MRGVLQTEPIKTSPGSHWLGEIWTSRDLIEISSGRDSEFMRVSSGRVGEVTGVSSRKDSSVGGASSGRDCGRDSSVGRARTIPSWKSVESRSILAMSTVDCNLRDELSTVS